MKEYIKVEITSDDNTVDKLMKQGWEIIATNNYVIEPPDSRTQYHLGLPAKVRIEELREIIRQYEEFGFKGQLLQKIAEQNEDKLEDYTEHGGRPAYGETVNFIKKYEDVVNNKNVNLYTKLDPMF
ncbi:hypothetical protein WQ54_19340 [Bacillus sp. SA1-12]|uniref:hypothetical protein n=1 Tax=Bacillus sp. SA1-12 TaxID=1455638 RepID=UPI0006271CBC|nr:hypothetical protein [Bacillus sp. SA1-12]KKI90676.1 hypothetical protein WQ54_19340 [Bacillus sp. SA1-12]